MIAMTKEPLGVCDWKWHEGKHVRSVPCTNWRTVELAEHDRKMRLEEHYEWPDAPIHSRNWLDWAKHVQELSHRGSERIRQLRSRETK